MSLFGVSISLFTGNINPCHVLMMRSEINQFENLYFNDFIVVAFVHNALLKIKGTIQRLLSP